MTSLTNSARTVRPVGLLRLAVVGAGAAAALALWAASLPFVHLDQPGFGGRPAAPLGAGQVVVAALLGGLLGWGVLAVLERFTARPRTLWLVVAPIGLLLSLGGPLSGDGVDPSDRLVLVAMHLAVAAVVVPLLLRTARR